MKLPIPHSVIILSILLFGPAASIATDELFDSNGVKIRYVTAGSGQAVVLIHGWMADATMWGRDADGNPRLDTTDIDGFQLIALDCRGHGKSDKPYEADKYGVEMASDVVRLLDHLKIAKAHLIGYSSGAFIAGHIAATQPERVLSVIYAGQAPVITELIRPNDFAECENFANVVDKGKGLGEYVRATTPEGWPQPTDAQADTIAKFRFAGKDVKALALAGCTFKELAVSGEQLRKCTAPTLFIRGENESGHVKSRVDRVRKLLAHSELKIIKGGDHMTTLVRPEFAETVREFLRTSKGK